MNTFIQSPQTNKLLVLKELEKLRLSETEGTKRLASQPIPRFTSATALVAVVASVARLRHCYGNCCV